MSQTRSTPEAVAALCENVQVFHGSTAGRDAAGAAAIATPAASASAAATSANRCPPAAGRPVNRYASGRAPASNARHGYCGRSYTVALNTNGAHASSAPASGRGRASENHASPAIQAKSAISTAARSSGAANGSTTWTQAEGASASFPARPPSGEPAEGQLPAASQAATSVAGAS